MDYYKKIHQLANNVSEEDFIILMENKYQRMSGYEVSTLLLEEVAYCSHITVEMILSKTRDKKVIIARQFHHYLCILLTPLSDLEIGKRYKNLSRGTVLNSVKRIQGYLDVNEIFLHPYKPLIEKYNLK